MAKVKIVIGETVIVTNVDSYEQAKAAFEFAARDLPKSTKFTLVFDGGQKKILVIKEIRNLTGLLLVQAKEAVDRGWMEIVGESQANQMKLAIERAGGIVSEVRQVA